MHGFAVAATSAAQPALPSRSSIQPCRLTASQIGHREIREQGLAEQQTLRLAILGEQTNAVSDCVGRTADRAGALHRRDTISPAVIAIRAENQAQQFGSPRADEAGQPDDFARVQCQGSRR